MSVCWKEGLFLTPSLPVHSDGQQATHWRDDWDADHGVKHIVHLPDEVVLHHQLSVVEEIDNDGLPGVGHTHQHVSYSQTATTKQVRLIFDHNHRCSHTHTKVEKNNEIIWSLLIWLSKVLYAGNYYPLLSTSKQKWGPGKSRHLSTFTLTTCRSSVCEICLEDVFRQAIDRYLQEDLLSSQSCPHPQ